MTREITLPDEFDKRDFCKSWKHTAHHTTVNALLNQLSEQRVNILRNCIVFLFLTESILHYKIERLIHFDILQMSFHNEDIYVKSK